MHICDGIYIPPFYWSSWFLVSITLHECHRSLLRKRNEAAELKETSKQLKQQLKAKKRGIDALEEMLKEANRKNAGARKRIQQEEEHHDPPPLKQNGLLKFFVSGPDGLCVEFQSKSDSLVLNLKREVKQAFRSKHNGDEWADEGSLRLLRYGRVMTDSSTLAENDLSNGDTVIAIVDNTSKPSTVPSDTNTELMLNFMGKQQDSINAMTSEMR